MPHPLEQLRIFAYVQAEKAPFYRAVMRAFIDAKARFSLHMRPLDVLAELAHAAPGMAAGEREEALAAIETALDQLCGWGNLEAHPDTADVATVQDFYRRRFLYQLTPEGEAAEGALALYHQLLEQPGELQSVALDDIRTMLAELLQLARAEPLDASKTHRTLRELVSRFDELTRRAQAFIGGLQRRIDLQGVDIAAFLAYKETLIDYLERFIGELVLATSDIAGMLGRIEHADVDRALRAAAERDLADAVEPTAADRQAALAGWRRRWRGLASWFRGADGASQAEILRARARAAIPALLATVESIHDRRVTKSDRATDLRTLARWFAEADRDADAHRLWRQAFGLASCRHLRIDAETLAQRDQQPVAASVSWLQAPPLALPIRLRQTGRYRRRGRTAKVIDRSRDKAHLARLAALEAQQLAAARQRLAGHDGAIRLSAIGALDADAFALFLDLLGEALARWQRGGGPVEATSSDGGLAIVLEPADGGWAVVDTPHGRFSGPDHRITIVDLVAEPAAAVVDAVDAGAGAGAVGQPGRAAALSLAGEAGRG